MGTIRRFEDLKAWQQARRLAREMYRIAEEPALARRWALINQVTSASLSPMSNIAEGFGRRTDKEFIAFLSNAHGSVAECQSLLYALLDNGFIEEERFRSVYRQGDRVSRLIQALANYLAGRKKVTETQDPAPSEPPDA